MCESVIRFAGWRWKTNGLHTNLSTRGRHTISAANPVGSNLMKIQIDSFKFCFLTEEFVEEYGKNRRK